MLRSLQVVAPALGRKGMRSRKKPIVGGRMSNTTTGCWDHRPKLQAFNQALWLEERSGISDQLPLDKPTNEPGCSEKPIPLLDPEFDDQL